LAALHAGLNKIAHSADAFSRAGADRVAARAGEVAAMLELRLEVSRVLALGASATFRPCRQGQAIFAKGRRRDCGNCDERREHYHRQ
jgi:hypothetical protein